MKMFEKRKRSIAKTISWRILATLATATLVFGLLGELILAISIGSLDAVVKLILYYAHERIWARIKWGVNPTA